MTHEPKWLEVAHKTSFITVLVAVLTSLFLFVLPILLQRRKREGAIQLQDEHVIKTRKGLFSRLLLDHIDNMGGDGEPIDLQAFWKEVSLFSHDLAFTVILTPR